MAAAHLDTETHEVAIAPGVETIEAFVRRHHVDHHVEMLRVFRTHSLVHPLLAEAVGGAHVVSIPLRREPEALAGGRARRAAAARGDAGSDVGGREEGSGPKCWGGVRGSRLKSKGTSDEQSAWSGGGIAGDGGGDGAQWRTVLPVK